MRASQSGCAALLVVALVGCKSSEKSAKSTEERPTIGQTASDDASSSPLAANAQAIIMLRGAIDERYSHRDQLGLDWDAVFARHRDALEAAPDATTFAELTAAMLAEAKDTHIMVIADGHEPLPTYAPPLRFNIDGALLVARVKGLRDVDPCIAVGKLDDRTSYLLLKSFRAEQCPRFGGAFNAAFEEIRALPRMVVDARGNSGGDETLGRLVAARFVEGDLVYALTELGPPRNNTAQFPRRIMGAREAQRYNGDVRLLIGNGNLSSAESFILMMKRGARVKTLGAATYGSSGNPKGVVLGNGVTVNLPSWRAFTRDGTAIEGLGIKPDIAVEWPDGTKVDVVLDAALASF